LNYRSLLQQLAEYGHRQQEELLKRQEQLQRVHDHLMENSKSMLAAQVRIFFQPYRFSDSLDDYSLLILHMESPFLFAGIFRIKASNHVYCFR
jgi:hypothetical protein